MRGMVERVAQAICGDDNPANILSIHRIRARAAIEAMRELPEEPGPRYIAGEYSRRTQCAMVDDALEWRPLWPATK